MIKSYTRYFLVILSLFFSQNLLSDENIIEDSKYKKMNFMSEEMEGQPDCNSDSFSKIRFLDISYFDYLNYLKEKKEKNFCDHINTAFISFSFPDLYESDLIYESALSANNLNPNRHSFPSFVFGYFETISDLNLEKNNSFASTNYYKAEKYLLKALEINDSLSYLALSYLAKIYLYEQIPGKISEGKRLVNLCISHYIPGHNFYYKENLVKGFNNYYQDREIIENLDPYECMGLTAYVFQNGLDVEVDEELAFEINKILSDHNRGGYEIVARAYCEGLKGQRFNFNKGKYYLEKGVYQNDWDSQFYKYSLLKNGECGYKRDRKAARQLIREIYLWFQDIDSATELAEDLFFGTNGNSDQAEAIRILSDFAKKGNRYALIELSYYLTYPSGNIPNEFYDPALAISYIESFFIDTLGIDSYYVGWAYNNLAWAYVLEFADTNKIEPSWYNDYESYQGFKFERFSDPEELNRAIYDTYYKACQLEYISACEITAVMKAYGRVGIVQDLTTAAYLYSKVWGDLSQVGYYPILVEDFPEIEKLINRFVRDKSKPSETREKWGLILVSADYIDKSITDIPQANRDGELIDELLTKNGFMAWRYHDEPKSFYDNISNEIETFVKQGPLIFNNNEIRAEERDLVFYYSGHAISYDGKNYLVPIDSGSEFQSFDEARGYLVSVNKLIKKLSMYFKGTMIIILDACRTRSLKNDSNIENGNFSFLSKGDNFYFSATDIDGLAPIDAGPNKYIIFASEAGKPALYKKDLPNSIFTNSLYEAINRFSDEDIESQVLRARKNVMIKTNDRQTPAGYSTLSTKFYLNKDLIN